jgi:hypothetical protein
MEDTDMFERVDGHTKFRASRELTAPHNNT